MKILCAPLRRLQTQHRKRHKKPYAPKKILVEGNHEQRYGRIQNKYPKFVITDLYDELGFTDPAIVGADPWTVVPFKSSVTVNGIDYTHVPHDKMGRPVSGVMPARNVALQSVRPTVFGHTHTFGVYNLALMGPDNGVRCCINIASFMPDGHIESYAKGSTTGWQYMVMKVFPSKKPMVAPDIETIQNWRLKELYG